MCEKYGKILSPSNIPLMDFFYVPRYHMLYCRIQKCGTTSWVEGTLQGLAPSLGLEEYKDIKRKRNKFKYFEVNSSQSWYDIMEENPLSIVHVRHPFERLASGRDYKRVPKITIFLAFYQHPSLSYFMSIVVSMIMIFCNVL